MQADIVNIGLAFVEGFALIISPCILPILPKGNIVYTHFGEGEYDVTENNIRFLLGLKEQPTTTLTIGENEGSAASETPEIYLGYARAAHFLSPEPVNKDQPKDVVSSSLHVDKHALYETVALNKSDDGVLQVIASAPGLEVYTFTFGE